MILPQYEFTCEHGHIFQNYELDEFTYGEFLLRSPTGEVRYLNALESIPFLEVCKIVDNSEYVRNIKDIDTSDLKQSVFSISCDRSFDNSLFVIDSFPACPECKSRNMEDWQESDSEVVEVDIQPVTHVQWNSLSQEEKEFRVNEAIVAYLEENMAYMLPCKVQNSGILNVSLFLKFIFKKLGSVYGAVTNYLRLV